MTDRLTAIHRKLEDLSAYWSGRALGAATVANAEKRGLTVEQYMTSDDPDESSMDPMRDADALLTVGELDDLVDEIEKMAIALHVELGGEWFGPDIPEFGVISREPAAGELNQ